MAGIWRLRVTRRQCTDAQGTRITIKLLQWETPAFISPDMWSSNSADLNAVDYKIWGVMQDWVYQKKVKDVNELRERLVEFWAGLQQNVLDDANDQWRRRLCSG